MGDWGRNGGLNQTAVANAMALKAEAFNPEFVISVGDNFYESEPSRPEMQLVCNAIPLSQLLWSMLALSILIIACQWL